MISLHSEEYNYQIAKKLGKEFLYYPIDNIQNAPDKILIIRGIIESQPNNPDFLENMPFFKLTSTLKKNIEIILKILDLDLEIKFEQFNDDISYNLYLIDTNCLDFFGILYKNIDINTIDDDDRCFDINYYKFYIKMCQNLYGCTHNCKFGCKHGCDYGCIGCDHLCGDLRNYFKFMKTRKDAVAPFKKRPSDSGYDLTLLEKVKEYGNVELYDTGIKIQPKFGYYFDMVPRSSIIKTGYMLANSTGIIDASYRESIKVALIKVDPNAKPLTMPNRLVQLIPRQINHQDVKEVETFDFGTDRNLCGFGSSDQDQLIR